MRRSALPSPKKITSATAVADFLGIEVYEKASSHQVSVAIQKVLDALKRENTLLRSANRLISAKNPEKAEQFGTVLERAKALGIDLNVLVDQAKALGIHLNIESIHSNCTDATPIPQIDTHTHLAEDSSDWGAKKPRHSTRSKREAAA